VLRGVDREIIIIIIIIYLLRPWAAHKVTHVIMKVKRLCMRSLYDRAYVFDTFVSFKPVKGM